jgi:putative copper resistance protein D
LGNLMFYARTVHLAANIMTAGVVFFIVFIAEPAFGKAPLASKTAAAFRLRLTRIAWISIAFSVLSGMSWLVLVAASMSGQPVAAVYAQGTLWTVLSQTDFGNDWLARSVFVCVLAGLLIPLLSATGAKPPWLKAAAVIFSALLVGSLAWAGHAIGAQGIEGIVHPAADVLHLIAAAAWVGTLVPLALLLSMTGKNAALLPVARTATLRFSTLGIASVGTLLLTGMVNTWYLVGSVSALTESNYGRLLLIKLALFLTMVGIAAFNWSQLTPSLVRNAHAGAAQKARRALCRNAAIEASFGAVIIGIVAVLGTLPPASHAHHEVPSGAIPADASFQHIHGEDGMADVLIEPGHVGTVRATIHLLNDDLETLAAKAVTITLTAPTPGTKPMTRTAGQDADGAWHVDGLQLPVPGKWTVNVAAMLTSNKHLELTAPIVIDPK